MVLQTITMKVQIYADVMQKQLLLNTLQAYTDACNFVSDYVFDTHELKQACLNQVLYYTLRSKCL